MIKTFKFAQKLKNTYRVNSIIFSLKQLPIIGKHLTENLYNSKGLKVFASIISFLIEISNIIISKPLYMLAFIFLPSMAGGEMSTDSFLHIFTFLTVAGTVLNCHFFEASKHKYYAVTLIKMDAKKYILSTYYYFVFKILAGITLGGLILYFTDYLSLEFVLMMPFFMVFLKAIVICFLLIKTKKSNFIFNEDKPTKKRWVFIALSLAAAYILPMLGIVIDSLIFTIIFGVVVVLGIAAMVYIVRFKGYSGIYKRLLTSDIVVVNISSQIAKEQKISYGKQIDATVVDTKNKTGYALFHEIFVQRHKKILTRSAKNTAVIASIILVAALAGVFVNAEFKKLTNEFILAFLPAFLYLMLMINRGQVVASAMFMNCDNCMLKYRFYRQPTVILELFTKRLTTLIQINLLPAIIIATGLPVLLYCSGGTDNNLNYLVLFVSIIAMSVFFSVHFLILYYLLQPYNAELKMKSSLYTIINIIVYILVFSVYTKKIPTILFGVYIVTFMIIYIVLALVLAYKLAPKTFKLR